MVFFFKQKTAYDMRISDWSSDVCSSDLLVHLVAGNATLEGARLLLVRLNLIVAHVGRPLLLAAEHELRAGDVTPNAAELVRSEERRVGKECVSTCRSRRWPSL